MAKAAKAIPEGFHSITPQLTLDDAAQAIHWYVKALGAREIRRSAGPDGKIMYAELKFGDSRIMVNDAMTGFKGPKGFGGSPASLWLYVEDSDAVYNRAVGAGGTVQVPLLNRASFGAGDRSRQNVVDANSIVAPLDRQAAGQ